MAMRSSAAASWFGLAIIVALLQPAAVHAGFSSFDVYQPAVSYELDNGDVRGARGNVSFPINYAGQEVLVALRFTKVPLPPNALVSNCRLIFPTEQSGNATNETVVWIQATTRENSTLLTTADNDISGRQLLPQVSEWSIGAWEDWLTARTSQLFQLVQTTVDSPSWEKEGAIVFVVRLPPSAQRTGVASEHTFVNDVDRRPLLRVDFLKLHDNIPGSGNMHVLTRFVSTTDGIALIVLFYIYAGATMAVVGFSYTTRRRRRERAKLVFSTKTRRRSTRMSLFSSGPNMTPNHPLFEWELPPSALVIRQEIGTGRFGRIYAGTAKHLKDHGTVDCAVKMMNATEGTEEHNIFFEAAYTMHTFAFPEHINVLRLFGVVTNTHPNMIITELCECGSLQEVLVKAKAADARPSAHTLLLSERIKLLADIARGMAFLSNQGFVHRYLAARNCLVDGDLNAKVGGFDSAHWVTGKPNDFQHGVSKLPIRWLSPQSLADGRYTTKSDVWTFGVCIWEAVTYCAKPYGDIRDDEECADKIMLGLRMDKPTGCPDSLYVIMRQCWHMGPNSRPDFEDLLASLVELQRAYSRSESRAGLFNPRKSVIMDGLQEIPNDAASSSASSENFHRSRQALESSQYAPTGGAQEETPSDRLTKISYSPTPEEAANSNSMAALRSHVGNYTLGRGLAKSIRNLRNTSESSHRLRSISDVEDTMKPGADRTAQQTATNNNQQRHHLAGHIEEEAKPVKAVAMPHYDHADEELPAYDKADEHVDSGRHNNSDMFAAAFAMKDVKRSNPLYHVDAYEDNVLAYKRDPVRRDFVEATEDDVRAGELVFERVQVLKGQAPRPEKFEFWDPHDRDHMYVPMSEDTRFHIVRGITSR